MGRLSRNKWSFLLGILMGIVIYLLKVSAKTFPNYVDLMSGSLSLASVATAFLFASIALVPALSSSKLVHALIRMHTDKKLLDRLLITTLFFFINAILSLVLLMFSAQDMSILNRIIVALWLGTGTTSIMETVKILRILFRALKYYEN